MRSLKRPSAWLGPGASGTPLVRTPNRDWLIPTHLLEGLRLSSSKNSSEVDPFIQAPCAGVALLPVLRATSARLLNLLCLETCLLGFDRLHTGRPPLLARGGLTCGAVVIRGPQSRWSCR